MRIPKIGRRATDDEKAEARNWVELYRKAQQVPGGRLCLNPDDAPEEQVWIDGRDPEPLLRIMEDFAELGTFQQSGGAYDSIRLWPLRAEYQQARQAGETHESVIDRLADKHKISTRSIERKVSTDKA